MNTNQSLFSYAASYVAKEMNEYISRTLSLYAINFSYKPSLEEYLQQGIENVSPEKLSSIIENKYVVEDLLINFDTIYWIKEKQWT